MAALMIISLVMAPFPAAHAVSDEVAVQLLERLGELEQELSNLRGENEVLRKELLDIQALQREGFLEVDERVSGLEKQQLPATATVTPDTSSLSNSVISFPATNPQAPTANTDILTPETSVLTTEAPTAPSTVVATPSATITMTPGAPDAEVIPNVTVPQLADENVAAQRQAVAPVNAENTLAATGTDTPEKVDPNSPDSYYFYGTQDKNTDITTDSSKVSLTAEKPVQPVQAEAPSASVRPSIPDAHKAKAAYNQAYKLLVNDPKSAVPAFRAFMKDYPDHELVANAQYWLGEALYAQKDFSGATQEFMQVLKKHKGSPKAPGAALKLGYSFYELRQWDFARRTLEDTVQFFPDTNAATLATSRLDRMKSEGR